MFSHVLGSLVPLFQYTFWNPSAYGKGFMKLEHWCCTPGKHRPQGDLLKELPKWSKLVLLYQTN